AVATQALPIIMGIAILSAVLVVAANLAVDLGSMSAARSKMLGVCSSFRSPGRERAGASRDHASASLRPDHASVPSRSGPLASAGRRASDPHDARAAAHVAHGVCAPAGRETPHA